MKQTSLAEIATKLKINKSRLAYYFKLKLLKPVSKFGKMNVFEESAVLQVVKRIDEMQKKGKTLKEILKLK